MLVAAFIFVISSAAMVQFALFTWHAGLLRLASEPLAADFDSAALVTTNPFPVNNFREAEAVQNLCPELRGTSAPKLGTVRLYYQFLQFLGSLSESMTTPNGWAQREMALCTRYANVVLSQRMVRNQAMLAEVRSY